jgi:hypothetical protein
MRKIGNTIWRFDMDPILTFLRKIDSDEKVGVNSLGKIATSVANEMINRGVLVKRIPVNSRSFKYCMANRQLFEDYSKKKYPLGLYAIELEEKTREASAKSRRGSKKAGSKIDEEIFLLKIFNDDALMGGSVDVANLQYQHFGIFAMRYSDSKLLANGNWLTVENHETFHLINGENTSSFHGSILLSGTPTYRQIDWMSRSSKIGTNFLHFGDLDISAISHYLSMKNLLKDSIKFWLPEVLDIDLFRNKGNKELFNRQSSNHNLTKMQNKLSSDENASQLIRLIKQTGFVIEQELLHEDFISSN